MKLQLKMGVDSRIDWGVMAELTVDFGIDYDLNLKLGSSTF